MRQPAGADHQDPLVDTVEEAVDLGPEVGDLMITTSGSKLFDPLGSRRQCRPELEAVRVLDVAFLAGAVAGADDQSI